MHASLACGMGSLTLLRPRLSSLTPKKKEFDRDLHMLLVNAKSYHIKYYVIKEKIGLELRLLSSLWQG